MKLSALHVRNLRSIVDSGEFAVPSLMALVGENNSGKSNILRSINILVSAGAGGLAVSDFKDPSVQLVIKGTFDGLSEDERKRWKPYLVGGKLILEKHAVVSVDERSGKEKVSGEYHGYQAEPKDWFLSITKITEKFEKPKWLDIAKEARLPDYFIHDGKCNKSDYSKALEKYLMENDVEFDTPDLSRTQALGLQSNVVASLPSVHLLPAITDYSDEIDRRSSSTTFRRLMGDLADRILQKDPRFCELQNALDVIRRLLNSIDNTGSVPRMEALSKVEARLGQLMARLMPSVQKMGLSVNVQNCSEMFTSGVNLSVDDGVTTDVLAKGNGLQRCVVFTLLQALILNERSELLESPTPMETKARPIVLLIEEPELYIHPQLGKLFFDVMREFAEGDQIIYSTHSPLFVDAYEYQSVAIVSKPSVSVGTVVKAPDSAAFDGLSDKKIFKGFALLNPSINELFFARRVVLMEGPQDMIVVTKAMQKSGKIRNRIEELDWTGIVCNGKQCIPFFQRVLNAFDIPYVVLHDADTEPGMTAEKQREAIEQNNAIKALAGTRKVVTYPIKLERSLGLANHFSDQFEAHCFCQEPGRITQEVERIVQQVFE